MGRELREAIRTVVRAWDNNEISDDFTVPEEGMSTPDKIRKAFDVLRRSIAGEVPGDVE